MINPFRKAICLLIVMMTVNASPLFAGQFEFEGKEGLGSLYGLSLYKDTKNYYLILHVGENTRTVSDYIVVPDPPEGYGYEIGLCTLKKAGSESNCF